MAYLGKPFKTNFMKTRPVAEELFDVDKQTEGRTDRLRDGQTDITMLIFRFRIFVNALKNI